jgi:hypothetical protein
MFRLKELRMFLRTILLAAVVTGPLVSQPTSASAQAQGLDRAVVATARAESVAGWTKNQAAKRPSALPKGIQKDLGEGTLPPGIRRTRQAAAPPPPPASEPDIDECGMDLVFVDGQLVYQDCNGGIVGMLGML